MNTFAVTIGPMNDVAAISLGRGAELFAFNYAHADLADTFVFTNGNWGQFRKLGAEVGNTITPGFGSDGNSVPSAAVVSVPLFHLATYTSAHIRWEGTGVTLSYTLDGNTWVKAEEATAVALDPTTNPDLDIRVEFAGNVLNDPAVLNSLTVYVLRTDSLIAASGNRTATFSADELSDDGIKLTGGGLKVAADTSPVPTNVGAIEMWVRFDATAANNLSVLDTPGLNTFVGFSANKLNITAASAYVDGAAVDATAGKYLDGQFHHIIVNLATPTNTGFQVAQSYTTGVSAVPMTVKLLATYPTAISAADAKAIYTSGAGPAPIRVNDAGTIGVTQPAGSDKVYSYSWAIAPGSAR